STIRILNNCRCSVVAARSRDSNTARSFGFSRTSIASGIIAPLKHDAERDDSAKVTQSLQIPGTRRRQIGGRTQRRVPLRLMTCCALRAAMSMGEAVKAGTVWLTSGPNPDRHQSACARAPGIFVIWDGMALVAKRAEHIP